MPNINTPEYWDEVYGLGRYEDDGEKANIVIQHIEDGTKVCDLGSGDGFLCRGLVLLRPKCEIHGVDFSRAGIEKAMMYCGNEANFHVADVTETGLESNYFDYVVSTEVLEHLDVPIKLIEEAYRLLKPGGNFIMSTPYLDHIPSGEHVHQFDYKDVETMMWDCGFDKVWVYPFASGRYVHNEKKEIVYPKGNWDTIMTLGIK